MKVDYQTCLTELVEPGGSALKHILSEWETRPGYEAVRSFAKNFVHEKLFELTGASVIDAINRGEHALGAVKKEEQLPDVEDFTCPFSWSDSFHAFIEERGRPPSFNEFRTWLTKERPEFVWNALKKTFPVREVQYQRAIRWRIGKAYYSLMRELYILTMLRTDFGITLNYHVIADVRLRVDFWKGTNLFVLYFPNKKYRDDSEGRKMNPVKLFPAAKFTVTKVEVERGGFGKAWLLETEKIRAMATTVRTAMQKAKG